MNTDRKITFGLKQLIEFDHHLMEVNASERSATHRLGMYYQDLFPKWHVDCEYNRYFGKTKDVEIDIRHLLARMADLLRQQNDFIALNLINELSFIDEKSQLELIHLGDQLRNPDLEYSAEEDLFYFILHLLNGDKIKKTVVPDIVVHKRNRRNNFIAVEVKMGKRTSPASIEYDKLKLQALINDKRYGYKHGYFIDMPVLDRFERLASFSLTPDPYEPRSKLILPILR